jgi:hypothetical protein
MAETAQAAVNHLRAREERREKEEEDQVAWFKLSTGHANRY